MIDEETSSSGEEGGQGDQDEPGGPASDDDTSSVEEGAEGEEGGQGDLDEPGAPACDDDTSSVEEGAEGDADVSPELQRLIDKTAAQVLAQILDHLHKHGHSNTCPVDVASEHASFSLVAVVVAAVTALLTDNKHGGRGRHFRWFVERDAGETGTDPFDPPVFRKRKHIHVSVGEDEFPFRGSAKVKLGSGSATTITVQVLNCVSIVQCPLELHVVAAFEGKDRSQTMYRFQRDAEAGMQALMNPPSKEGFPIHISGMPENATLPGFDGVPLNGTHHITFTCQWKADLALTQELVGGLSPNVMYPISFLPFSKNQFFNLNERCPGLGDLIGPEEQRANDIAVCEFRGEQQELLVKELKALDQNKTLSEDDKQKRACSLAKKHMRTNVLAFTGSAARVDQPEEDPPGTVSESEPEPAFVPWPPLCAAAPVPCADMGDASSDASAASAAADASPNASAAVGGEGGPPSPVGGAPVSAAAGDPSAGVAVPPGAAHADTCAAPPAAACEEAGPPSPVGGAPGCAAAADACAGVAVPAGAAEADTCAAHPAAACEELPPPSSVGGAPVDSAAAGDPSAGVAVPAGAGPADTSAAAAAAYFNKGYVYRTADIFDATGKLVGHKRGFFKDLGPQHSVEYPKPIKYKPGSRCCCQWKPPLESAQDPRTCCGGCALHNGTNDGKRCCYTNAFREGARLETSFGSKTFEVFGKSKGGGDELLQVRPIYEQCPEKGCLKKMVKHAARHSKKISNEIIRIYSPNDEECMPTAADNGSAPVTPPFLRSQTGCVPPPDVAEAKGAASCHSLMVSAQDEVVVQSGPDAKADDAVAEEVEFDPESVNADEHEAMPTEVEEKEVPYDPDSVNADEHEALPTEEEEKEVIGTFEKNMLTLELCADHKQPIAQRRYERGCDTWAATIHSKTAEAVGGRKLEGGRMIGQDMVDFFHMAAAVCVCLWPVVKDQLNMSEEEAQGWSKMNEQLVLDYQRKAVVAALDAFLLRVQVFRQSTYQCAYNFDEHALLFVGTLRRQLIGTFGLGSGLSTFWLCVVAPLLMFIKRANMMLSGTHFLGMAALTLMQVDEHCHKNQKQHMGKWTNNHPGYMAQFLQSSLELTLGGPTLFPECNTEINNHTANLEALDEKMEDKFFPPVAPCDALKTCSCCGIDREELPCIDGLDEFASLSRHVDTKFGPDTPTGRCLRELLEDCALHDPTWVAPSRETTWPSSAGDSGRVPLSILLHDFLHFHGPRGYPLPRPRQQREQNQRAPPLASSERGRPPPDQISKGDLNDDCDGFLVLPALWSYNPVVGATVRRLPFLSEIFLNHLRMEYSKKDLDDDGGVPVCGLCAHMFMLLVCLMLGHEALKSLPYMKYFYGAPYTAEAGPVQQTTEVPTAGPAAATEGDSDLPGADDVALPVESMPFKETLAMYTTHMLPPPTRMRAQANNQRHGGRAPPQAVNKATSSSVRRSSRKRKK